jgi:glutamyl-tRNA synthetase
MAPAVRFRLSSERRQVSDRLQGVRAVDLIGELGDPVLYRRDGMFGYQLATVVDDHLMGIDHVVRARDLWADAALQATVGAALGATEPAWLHLPLVVDAEGRRLSKRWGAWTLAELRSRGASAARLRSWTARQLGVASAAVELSPEGFVTAVSRARDVPRGDVVVHADTVDALLTAT